IGGDQHVHAGPDGPANVRRVQAHAREGSLMRRLAEWIERAWVRMSRVLDRWPLLLAALIVGAGLFTYFDARGFTALASLVVTVLVVLFVSFVFAASWLRTRIGPDFVQDADVSA